MSHTEGCWGVSGSRKLGQQRATLQTGPRGIKAARAVCTYEWAVSWRLPVLYKNVCILQSNMAIPQYPWRTGSRSPPPRDTKIYWCSSPLYSIALAYNLHTFSCIFKIIYLQYLINVNVIYKELPVHSKFKVGFLKLSGIFFFPEYLKSVVSWIYR